MANETTSDKKGLIDYSIKDLVKMTRDVLLQYAKDVKEMPEAPINKEFSSEIPFTYPNPFPITESFWGYYIEAGDCNKIYPVECTQEKIEVRTLRSVGSRSRLLKKDSGGYRLDPETTNSFIRIVRHDANGSASLLSEIRNSNAEPDDIATEVTFYPSCKACVVQKSEDGTQTYKINDFGKKTDSNAAEPSISKETFDEYNSEQPFSVEEVRDLHNILFEKIHVPSQIVSVTATQTDPCM